MWRRNKGKWRHLPTFLALSSLVIVSYFVAKKLQEEDEEKDVGRARTDHESRGGGVVGPSSTSHEKHGEDTRNDKGGMPLANLAPISPIRVLRPNPNLEIAFDVRTRNPVYALERLFAETEEDEERPRQENVTKRRRPHFYEESSLPPMYRSRNSYYHLSGYDRGHMAPVADFIKYGDKQVRDTFNLCNVSPQAPAINRGVWAALEEWARRVARDVGDKKSAVLVLSGPLWLPSGRQPAAENTFEFSYPAIGEAPSLVSVPTHFFKVVVVAEEAGQNITHFACFVVPNSEQKARDGHKKALRDYLVRWSDLEVVSGLELFPTLVRNKERWITTADALTDDQRGSRQYPLLLDDPSTRATPGRRVPTKNTPWPKVQHLCANQKCISLKYLQNHRHQRPQ